MRVLRDILDPELRRAQADTLRHTTRDDGDADPRLLEQVNAEAILNVVPLEFHGAPVDRAEVDPAVGQHTIDVEHDKPDRIGER